MPADGQIVNSGPSIGEFKPMPGTMAEYELASDLTGIYEKAPRGLVIHYAGPIGDLVLSGSLWARRQYALDFFAERAGEGVTELVRKLNAPGRDPDLTYQLLPTAGITVGRRARDFELRARGAADGAVLIRTPGAPLPPSGRDDLILSALREDEDGHILYEFLTGVPAEIAEGAQLIHLHSIFTTGPGLDEVASG